MCFSATASFAVAAALVPAGVYCVITTSYVGVRWMPLAIYPFAFSVQQAVEGVLWLGIDSGDQAIVDATSRGFLFFSHFFWLAWLPFSMYWLEDEQWRRRLFLGLSAVGGIFGLSTFLPLLLMTDWLSVGLVERSIEYKTVLIYDGVVNRLTARSIYGLLVVSALFLSPNLWIRLFGGLITASFLGTSVFFPQTLVSVWCYFAAVISASIVVVLAIEHQRQRSSA